MSSNREADQTTPSRAPLIGAKTIIFITILLVFGVIGWGLWEVARLSGARPNISTDYDLLHKQLIIEREDGRVELNEARREQYLQILRALDDAIKAMNAMLAEAPRRDSSEGRQIAFDVILKGDVIPDQIEPERAIIASMREAGHFDALAELLQHPLPIRRLSQDAYAFAVELPELPLVRYYVRMRVASMRLALDEDDREGFLQATHETLGLARFISAQGFLIDSLVAIAIELLALGELRALLLEHELDEATLASLLEIEASTQRMPLEISLEGDRAAFMDFIQRAFSDDGRGSGFLLADGIDILGEQAIADSPLWNLPVLDSAMGRFITLPRAQTVEYADAIYEEMIARSRMRHIERAKLPAIRSLMDERATRRVNIASLVIPATDQTLNADAIASTSRCGVQIMIALELFRAKEGRYPTSLDELTPGILDEPPVDPLHGGPFGYRLLEEPDEHGRNYLLYSTGLDQTDDGGKMHDGPMRHASPFDPLTDPGLSGFDFIINLPRGSW